MDALAYLAAAAALQANTSPVPEQLVIIHPFIADRYHCSDHYEGELPDLGDALGTDCTIYKNGRSYDGNGTRNEDFYIWGKTVLAPIDGTVERVRINPVVNAPGKLGKPPASTITFLRADGVHVIFAHLAKITVKEGDVVKAGQPVAIVSNNGMSTGPHVHVGAWRDNTPLQIVWDLKAMAQLRKPK